MKRKPISCVGVGTALKKLRKGIHILADFYGCKGGSYHMRSQEALESFCEKEVKKQGLTQLGKLFYQFPNAGVTGMILLAESHISIHTWPEKDYLTLDIFVCNVTQDNTEKARRLYQSFEELFLPTKKNYYEIERE